ncbi:MAG: type II toxin-antitoxin system VapC family toxin [Nocardioidaceae bacterium]
MIVVDTSFVYALLDGRDDRHAEAAIWYRDFNGELATTPLVLAETDHLARARAGRAAAAAFRRDVESGAYSVEWWPSAATDSARIADRYAELDLPLTDASLVALARRLGTTCVASFDERHFRAVRPLAGGRAFSLMPHDEEPRH